MNPIYHQAKFINSSPDLKDTPEDQGKEIAFAGRSNAGKSSAINTLTRQNGLARISKTPGRTQMLNFFEINDQKRFVDLPGYGYAKVPIAVKKKWHELMEKYLTQRKSLCAIILVMDVRHPLTEFDWQMVNWCQDTGLPLHILLTKADKLTYGAAKNTLMQVQKELIDINFPLSIQLFSALKKTGVDSIARWPILKSLKDIVDKFGRSKMPILDNVTPPTIYLGSGVKKTILSFHIVTGNILAAEGKKVIQMITDPHVRSDYLQNANLPNMKFLVFDEATKEAFFKLAKELGKKIPKDQIKDKVIVTGPPIDPRVVDCNKQKEVWTKDRPLRICLTTGGLGTNKTEIRSILEQILPVLKQQALGQKTDLVKTELVFYAGTHKDHKEMAVLIAEQNQLAYRVIMPKDPAHFAINAKIENHQEAPDFRFSIIYHPQIVDANELLIQKAFPWADLFISKPSGDMAYDAVVSGAALLTLKEWGEWEFNVRAVFEKNSTAMQAKTENIVKQLIEITQSSETTFKTNVLPSASRPVPNLKEDKQTSWLEEAMKNSKKLDSDFYHGAKNILKAVEMNN